MIQNSTITIEISLIPKGDIIPGNAEDAKRASLIFVSDSNIFNLLTISVAVIL
jgi:hypothetical protein